VAVEKDFVIAPDLIHEEKRPAPTPDVAADKVQAQARLALVERGRGDVDKKVASLFCQVADGIAAVGRS